MIINVDSPLRHLPAQFTSKQILFFNGIRYAVDVADFAYSRLQKHLYEFTSNPRGNKPLETFEIVSPILDAWSIVDTAYRLRQLINHTPGLKQKTPEQILFLKHTSDIEELRHSAQHLETKIDDLITQGSPIWGSLSWFTAPAQDRAYGFIGVIVTGTQIGTRNLPMVNPAGRTVVSFVDLITLTANGYSISLSDTMKEIVRLTTNIEQQIIEKFTGEVAGTEDVLATVEFHPS